MDRRVDPRNLISIRVRVHASSSRSRHRKKSMKNPGWKSLYLAVASTCAILFVGVHAQSQSISDTAWNNGKFHIDVASVISRSDIVLSAPNTQAGEAMPLGNGSLGAAVWSANGFTAQLNRADTLPYRYSLGQVEIPGLALLTNAKDYSGRLDLYNGEFRESGGGMAATVYLQPHTDTMIIDVTGADADQIQTAKLFLWPPRDPRAAVTNEIGTLSQSWIDNKAPGASGRSFGSLSAITADGRSLSVAITDSRTITLSFRPYPDGHFRIMIAAPHYDGSQTAQVAVTPVLSQTKEAEHQQWWHAFWLKAATIKVTSADGVGDYMENLRNIYLYAAAAEKGKEYPGTQAGVADMLSSGRDAHHWDSSAFWHWNLRMQVAANLGAGLSDLNAPYFNLYRENLENIEGWTKQHMLGRPGICIPETMRFNGQGVEYEPSWPANQPSLQIAHDCDAHIQPYANSRTLSTGAEVSLWVWQQYLATNDRSFLASNYPIMAASARFLLAYQKIGPDGLLHTSPSNAHETQWDVADPTTDIAACLGLYPATIQAANLLGKDAVLARQLKAALLKIPPYPRALITSPHTLLKPAADAEGQDMIVDSYLPATINHNNENIGLEPVWPYSLIGTDSPQFPLALRTYIHRPYPATADWSYDPIQAARLGLGKEVGETLASITEKYQGSINGFANWDKEYGEFYVELDGIVATALQEALVQDYDGVIRIAPAVPPGWDFDGSVYVRGNTKVNVQVRHSVPTTIVIEAGTTQELKVRNPWPNNAIDVVSSSGAPIEKNVLGSVVTFRAITGKSYLIRRTQATNLHFVPVAGMPARSAKKLGPVQIGLFGKGQ
jgi:alpha-L-fucosidase 2